MERTDISVGSLSKYASYIYNKVYGCYPTFSLSQMQDGMTSMRKRQSMVTMRFCARMPLTMACATFSVCMSIG